MKELYQKVGFKSRLNGYAGALLWRGWEECLWGFVGKVGEGFRKYEKVWEGLRSNEKVSEGLRCRGLFGFVEVGLGRG